eukprot:1188664-Prorocentrum_minimum.AAC.4
MDGAGGEVPVWVSGSDHALQLPAGDPRPAANGRSLHGQQGVPLHENKNNIHAHLLHLSTWATRCAST